MTDDTARNAPESGSRRLFDIRILIAGLFGVYGVVLIIVGAVDSSAAIDKASGVHINLWTGIGMVALAALFAAWVWWRPLRPEDVRSADDPAVREISESGPGSGP